LKLIKVNAHYNGRSLHGSYLVVVVIVVVVVVATAATAANDDANGSYQWRSTLGTI
jgi:hypothetical protein